MSFTTDSIVMTAAHSATIEGKYAVHWWLNMLLIHPLKESEVLTMNPIKPRASGTCQCCSQRAKGILYTCHFCEGETKKDCFSSTGSCKKCMTIVALLTSTKDMINAVSTFIDANIEALKTAPLTEITGMKKKQPEKRRIVLNEIPDGSPKLANRTGKNESVLDSSDSETEATLTEVANSGMATDKENYLKGKIQAAKKKAKGKSQGKKTKISHVEAILGKIGAPWILIGQSKSDGSCFYHSISTLLGLDPNCEHFNYRELRAMAVRKCEEVLKELGTFNYYFESQNLFNLEQMKQELETT